MTNKHIYQTNYLLRFNYMKKTTFTRTTLATLITLSLTACGGHSYDGGSSVKPASNTNVDKVLKETKAQLTEAKGKVQALQEKLKKSPTKEAVDKIKKELKDAKDKVADLENKLSNAPTQKQLDNVKAEAEKEKEEAIKKVKADAEKAKEEAIKKVKADAEKAKEEAIKKALEDAKDKPEEAKAEAVEEAKKEAEKAKVEAVEKVKKEAEKAKAEAVEKVKKEAEKAKAEAVEKVKKEAEKAKAKAVEKAKKEAEKEAEKKVKKVKEKLDKFENVEDYQNGTVANKVEVPVVDAVADTPRDKFQKAIDKFDIKQVFDAKGSVDANDNATMSVPTGTIKIDIDGTEADISVNRHDLAYSSIASMSTQINTFMMPGFNDVLQQQTAASTVLAVVGQPTDTSKISFADLKAQNKGDLTYEGRAIYAYHVKEKHEAGGYPAKLKDAPYKYDIMKSENSWAKPTFKVSLENATISGNMQFGGTDQALKLVLNETAIEEKGNQLQFVGDINATQKRSTTEKDYQGNDITYSTPHVLEKDGKQKGQYDGVFMGPNAEELAGKFVIEQDYKRDDKKDSKYSDTVVGKYTQIGNINGVFNAKKIEKPVDKIYKK